VAQFEILKNMPEKFLKPTFASSPKALPFSFYLPRFSVVGFVEISLVSSVVLVSIPKNNLQVKL
jgi:hypothetical protein